MSPLRRHRHHSAPSPAIQAIGWLGVACVVGAYAGVTLGFLDPRQVFSLALNGVGAAALMVETAAVRNWQPFTLNTVWLVLALIGLLGVA
jgi:hypothetical protein